jgi:hypothetical protein
MAITLSSLSGTSSEVRNQFLEPLRAVYLQATTIRNCPAESDLDWLTKGVDRVLSNVRSGRDFLQTFQMFWNRELNPTSATGAGVKSSIAILLGF